MIHTSTNGILASDILIRSALIEGFNRLKTDPWLLDFVFAWIMNDPLTSKEYGEREAQDAKDWFLNTEFTFTMAYRHDRPQLPAVGIELVESNELPVASLGDIHSSPTEDIDATEVVIKPHPVLGPFTPKLYDLTQGLVTLPDDLTTTNLFENNIFYDSKANVGYPILEIVDETSFLIQAGVQANFTKAFVAPISSFYIAHLESSQFQETYRLRCYINSTPVHLSFLHSALVFVLKKYNQDLLEARGFERSSVSSQSITLAQGNDGPELIYARDVVITGFVRQYWPKTLTSKIDGILAYPIRIMDTTETPDAQKAKQKDVGWYELNDDPTGWG